jgi:hypothetical protein
VILIIQVAVAGDGQRAVEIAVQRAARREVRTRDNHEVVAREEIAEPIQPTARRRRKGHKAIGAGCEDGVAVGIHVELNSDAIEG